nr:hypothetical protein [Angustibacter aerolatus]
MGSDVRTTHRHRLHRRRRRHVAGGGLQHRHHLRLLRQRQQQPSTAAAVETSLGADVGGIPAAITAAGGTEEPTTPKPEGVSAQYGPVCKASSLGIGKIDFKTDTIGWAQSEKEANPFRIASTKSQIEAAKAKGWKPAHHERAVERAAGEQRHQGHDRQGRQGDHLLADQLHRSR